MLSNVSLTVRHHRFLTYAAIGFIIAFVLIIENPKYCLLFITYPYITLSMLIRAEHVLSHSRRYLIQAFQFSSARSSLWWSSTSASLSFCCSRCVLIIVFGLFDQSILLFIFLSWPSMVFTCMLCRTWRMGVLSSSLLTPNSVCESELSFVYRALLCMDDQCHRFHYIFNVSKAVWMLMRWGDTDVQVIY